MEDFFRANFATLKGSEVKVLFTLLELGVTQAPSAELMRLTGLTDRKTFYGALRNLEETGWLGWLRTRLENPTSSWEIQPVELGNHTVVVGKPYSPQLEKPTTSRETQPERLENPTPGGETQPEDQTLEARIAQADALDASGLPTVAKSPYQQRRKRQCMLLQEAWTAVFPDDPVAPEAMLLFLQAAHDEASAVYQAMLEAVLHSVKHPKSYILAILRSPKKKADAQEELRPVPDEMRKAWIENERQLEASGWLNGWDL